jgi:exosome complex RNA-binding protein Csl4
MSYVPWDGPSAGLAKALCGEGFTIGARTRNWDKVTCPKCYAKAKTKLVKQYGHSTKK